MDQAPAFCRYPADRAGCEAALVGTYEADELEKHCVAVGLRQGYEPCGAVVASGFRQRTNEMLLSACEWILVWGLREKVPAGEALFERETRGLVKAAISRRHVTDMHFREDIQQEVYLRLVNHLRKVTALRGHLVSYVWTTARNTAGRLLQNRALSAPVSAPEDRAVGTMHSTDPIPPSVIRQWDELDHKLAFNLRQDLIDRIILAQAYVLNWASGKRMASKELLADWKRLGALPKEGLAARVQEVFRCYELQREERAAELCSFMINNDLMEGWEMPLVFAVCDGLEESEIHRLIQRLASATITFIDQRIFRLKETLLRMRDE